MKAKTIEMIVDEYVIVLDNGKTVRGENNHTLCFGSREEAQSAAQRLNGKPHEVLGTAEISRRFFAAQKTCQLIEDIGRVPCGNIATLGPLSFPSLSTDTHYGDEIFSQLKNCQKFPIVQRNLLIIVARDYVRHPADENNKTPFQTNQQITHLLPTFYGGDASAIAGVLDGLIANIRRDEAEREKWMRALYATSPTP